MYSIKLLASLPVLLVATIGIILLSWLISNRASAESSDIRVRRGRSLREIYLNVDRFCCALIFTDCPVWFVPFRNSVIRLISESFRHIIAGVLISSQPDQEGNKPQQQKILIFIYPIYNHNWRNISNIYIYIYIYIYIKQDQHQTKYIGKQVGLRTYQHPCITLTCSLLCVFTRL